MAKTRDRILINHRDNVATVIQELTPVIPNNEKWELTRVIFADESLGDGKSGGFQVEYGNGTTWELVMLASLTGNTKDIPIKRTFTGDGVNRFRTTRQNNSGVSKTMAVLLEGIKRL